MSQHDSSDQETNGLVVVGLVVKDGEVLMVRRKRREGNLRWNFPGGSVEVGESPAHAIVREVKEETGVVCVPKRALGTRRHPDTGVEIMYWLCDWRAGEPRVKESDRQDRVRWASADEVQKLTTSNVAREIRRELRRLAQAQSVPAVV